MSLTTGTAPFARRPSGRFNFEPSPPGSALYFEDSPRWVRGEFAGETVVSSKRAKLLHETEHLPVYYFPLEDIRFDLLVPTEHSTRCPYKGQARYWSIVVGDRVAENAVWNYPEPIDAAPPLAGYAAFYWRKLDRWFEEDEEVFVHARDPYHRVDALASSRHVRVSLDGEVVAETRSPVLLFETGLPTRYYIPMKDVRRDLLVESDSQTRCPYKGIASYWSVRTASELHADLAWYYDDPLPAVEGIAGLVAFYNERVDLEVDGEALDRPVTRFSPR